ITAIRKRKGISQADLGKAVGTSGDIIGKYERDEVKPSVEVASRIADELQVSLDYLLGKTAVELDKNVLKRIEDIQQLDTDTQKHLLFLIDNVIQNFKTKKAFS